MTHRAESTIRLLSERKFEIVGKMDLWKRSDLLDRANGMGRISQDDWGRLQYEFQPDRNILSPDWFEPRKSGAGLVISDADHFDLSITDWTGQTWRADRVYPATARCQGSGSLISGHVRSVRCETQAREGLPHGLMLGFIGRHEFPANKWVTVTGVVDGDRVVTQSGEALAEFQAAGCSVRISSQAEWLEITLTRDVGEFQLGTVHRVSEALQFVLGKPLLLTAYELWAGTTRRFALFGVRRAPPHRASAAPIQLSSGYHEDRVWRLFDAYLTHTMQSESTMAHPLFQCANTVHRTEESYFEDRVLAMSRAVEALVKMISTRIEVHKITAEELKQATAAISALGFGDRSRERLLGSVRSAGLPSVTGVLHELRSRGCLTREEFKAWQRLRHSITHGDDVPLDQDAVTDRHRLEVLIHKLVFLAIGYKGPYTDYGSVDFPTRQYEHALGEPPQNESTTGAP